MHSQFQKKFSDGIVFLRNHRKPADELEGHSISVNSLMNSYRNPVSAANHVLDQGTKQNAAFHGFRSTATSVSYSFSQDQLPGNNVYVL